MKRPVSLIKYRDGASVREAIEAVDGFRDLKPGDRVLIKPNLVGWDNQGPYPPWGVLTTSRVMEALCAALKDHRAGGIEIGEASIDCKSIGSGTKLIFENLGWKKLEEKYGAKLTDFNRGEFDEVEIIPGHRLKVASRVRDCDFFINVPVLKTHGETKVSLGMKNLKGLLHKRSKSHCHHAADMLEKFIVRLAEEYTPSLTLIDGIYALEKGPLHFGIAHRFDLLIASADTYAADLLGAYVLGYGPDDIGYLKEYADRHGRETKIDELDVRGDIPADDARHELAWDWPWLEDNSGPPAFAKKGLKGLKLYKYDATLCTGCSYMFNPLMLTLMSSERKEFDDYEILSGKVMEPSGKASKTFLFGKCQVEKNSSNPACKEAIPIRGCPPTLDRIERVLIDNGVPVSRDEYAGYRRYVMNRYLKRPELFPPEDFYMDGVPEEAGGKRK